MPLSDRDYMKGKHPPTCTCVDCVNKRLGIVTRSTKKHSYRKNQKNRYIAKRSTSDYINTDNSNSTPVSSCFASIVVVLLIIGILGGGIYGIGKYHDNIWDGISRGYNWVAEGVSNLFNTQSLTSTDTTIFEVATPSSTPRITPTAIQTPTPSITKTIGIDKGTGEYKNYYLGLVKEPSGVIGGNDCYGEFIILINNKNAKNPSYTELLNFLKADKTDEFPYQYDISLGGFYYGEAEDQIDLDHIKKIIDGIEQPEDPKVCADFAERLHNNAEAAGIRCAYVDVNLSGYSDPFDYGISSNTGHALCAFETTDKGLVYIDDTGTSSNYAPSNCDKSVDVKIGKEFIPQSLFPEPGWYSTWDSMGVVTDIFITWDGEWR